MSKKVFPIGVTVAVLLAFVLGVLPAAADPHHLTSAASASCSGYNVTADYVGGSGTRRVTWDVTVTVDGAPTNYTGTWEGHSPGFDLFTASGGGAHDVQATGSAILFEWGRTGWGPWHDRYSWASNTQNDWAWYSPWWGYRHRHAVYEWVEIDRETFNLNFVNDCYTSDFDPEEGIDPDCKGWWGELKLFKDGQEVMPQPNGYKAGAWTDPYALENSGPITFTVTDGAYSYSETHTFYEPSDCQQAHDTGPWYTESCEGYEYGYILDGQHVKTGEGKWLDSFKAEEVWVTVVVPANEGQQYPDGAEFRIYIGKEEECLECKWTALYPMSIYEPSNPPQSYWRGPFDFHACAIIHDADEVPSADRVTMVCSLCPDQIEGGFIFNALNKPYTGYLWRVECYGKGVTFVFADDWHEFEWDEDWVRKGYTDDGHRCEDNPRIAGCSAWIHEQAGIPYYEPPDSQ